MSRAGKAVERGFGTPFGLGPKASGAQRRVRGIQGEQAGRGAGPRHAHSASAVPTGDKAARGQRGADPLQRVLGRDLTQRPPKATRQRVRCVERLRGAFLGASQANSRPR